MPKNKLFTTSGQYGVKRSGKWGKLTSSERAELDIQRGVYSGQGSVTSQQMHRLDKLLREIKEETNKRLAALRDYAEETGRFSPSIMPDIETPLSIDEKLQEIARGKLFLQEETSTVSGTESFFDEMEMDFSGETEKEAIDRWRIVRRILDMYPSKSISEILDYIDYLSENNPEMTEDEIAVRILEGLQAEQDRTADFEKRAKKFQGGK